MDTFQILALILVTLFYASYFTKQILLKKQGITANRLARGDKPRKTFIIELLLMFSTYALAIIQYVSVLGGHSSCSPPYAARVLGLCLLLTGVLIFICAIITMRDSWRAGVDKTQKTTMVTAGIYSLSRNPAFVGFNFLYLGTAIIFPNAFTVIGALAAMIIFHLQILEEESFLTSIFGEEYIEYRKKTKRYILIF